MWSSKAYFLLSTVENRNDNLNNALYELNESLLYFQKNEILDDIYQTLLREKSKIEMDIAQCGK